MHTTLDADTKGEIRYENFNAAKAEFQITGVNVHPGSSKDVMMNASLVAMEINKKWGRGTAVLTLTDQYRNMAEIIAGSMHLIKNAKKTGSGTDL